MQRFFWKIWNGDWEAIKLLLFIIAPFATLVPLTLQFRDGDSEMVRVVQAVGAGSVVVIVGWAVWQNWRRVERRAGQARARYGEQLRSLLAAVRASNTTVGAFAQQVSEHVTTIYCGARTLAVIDTAPQQPMDIAHVAHRMWSSPERTAELARRVRAMHARWNDEVDRPQIQVNAPHALVFSDQLPTTFDPALTSLKYSKSDYMVLRAALELNAESEISVSNLNEPHVMGAGGLLVFPERHEVLFLKRSAESDTHAFKWHVFGGNFEPDMRLPGRGFDRDLKANAEREILEESGALVDVDGAVLIVHRERADSSIAGGGSNVADWRRAMRYVPVHYCGLTLSREQYRRINPSPEGDIAAVAFSELEQTLADTSRWVPAAWWTVVSWLWLGAPCQHGEPVFPRGQAKRIARRLLISR